MIIISQLTADKKRLERQVGQGAKRMNVYLAELPVGDYTYGDDYAMVIVAEDELHAERKARWSSDNFKQAKKIIISQVSLDTEAVILKANVGG